MLRGEKIVMVMLAYNAAQTLLQTYEQVIVQECVDGFIVVEDAGSDETVSMTRRLDNVSVHVDDVN